MRKYVFSILLALFAPQLFATVDEHDVEDDDAKGKASFIIDNTGGVIGQIGVKTNLKTGPEENGIFTCEKDDALEQNKCNSFALKNTDLQVIQRQNDGNMSVDVGIFNSRGTSYDNANTDQRLTLFEPGKHVVNLDKLRSAANSIGLIKNTTLPPFTYGTITWQQFIKNVAEARTMYGIVRVKVPLQQITTEPKRGEEDKYRSKSGKRYQLCGQKKASKCGCGPGKDDDNDGEFEATNIKPGATICGTKIPSTARIDVRGSIMFDWVDCDQNGLPPIELDDLPESSREILFKVSVPIIVNPAEPRSSDGVMKTIDEIASLTANQTCNQQQGCSIQIENSISIPYAWIGEQSKDDYFSKTGKALTESVFNSLTAADRYELATPSGYEKGLADAFDKLNITHAYWQEVLGFRSNVDKQSSEYRQIIREADIRSRRFEDIPVYIYTGGLVDMHFHINISGLVYIPQALELEQKGQKLEKRVKIIDAEYGHRSREYQSSKNVSDDFHNHEYKSCKKQTEHYEQRISAKQYFAGAILVRDAFYVEAEHEGGVTIISHNQETYDQIILNETVGKSIRFKPIVPKSSNSESVSGGHDSPSTGETSPMRNKAQSSGRSPEWIEIKPR